MKKIIKPILYILLLSVVVEVIGFNFQYFASKNDVEKSVKYSISHGFVKENDKYYKVKNKKTAFVEIKNINENVNYIYIDTSAINEKKENTDSTMTIYAKDDGNKNYYKMADVSTFPTAEKTKYFKLHSYGKIQSLKLKFKTHNGDLIKINQIKTNCNVPMSFSLNRMLLIAIILILLYSCRPSAKIYKKQFNLSNKPSDINNKLAFLIIAANILVIFAFIYSNPAYLVPKWPTHNQYYELARAFANGRTNINVANENVITNLLSEMTNPYDSKERLSLLGIIDNKNVWDVAFFNGKFYVYFGMLPVLLFYLPYYLLFHQAFPTSVGVFICSALIIVSAFILMKKIIKKWFPNTTIGVYFVLSLMLGNCTGVLSSSFVSSFYFLPILMSIMFVYFGLIFWISALDNWEKEIETNKKTHKSGWFLFFGAMCMAIVAACRPQFLFSSLIAFPMFTKMLFKGKKVFSKGNISKLIVFAIPYIVVAVGVMYYNYIRFGSPFDFGANYNLTTNDMTLRGLSFGRLPTGLFMYLFQLPVISLVFPFIKPVDFDANYVGITIHEFMFGGVFFTNIFLWVLIFIRKVKEQLKNKGLYKISICLIFIALLVICLDTEGAGILARYYSDFLWMFMLPAIFVFLQLFENQKTEKRKKYLVTALIIAALCGAIMAIGIGFTISKMNSYSMAEYYKFKSWFM